MSSATGEIDPFTIVAEALGCPRELLTIDSAMKRTHGWDSLAHVSVVSALESTYEVSIPNEEMLSLASMKAIIEFHQRQTELEANGT